MPQTDAMANSNLLDQVRDCTRHEGKWYRYVKELSGDFLNWATHALYCDWNSRVPAQRAAMRRALNVDF
jgi:hypothetical protein